MKIEYFYSAVVLYFVVIIVHGLMRNKIDDLQKKLLDPKGEIIVTETHMKPIILRNTYRTNQASFDRVPEKQQIEFKERQFREAFRQITVQILEGKLYEVSERDNHDGTMQTEINVSLFKRQ